MPKKDITENKKIYIIEQSTEKRTDIKSNMFSNNIKYIRKQYKLNQKQMAKVINKDQAMISLWEQNKRTPIINDVIDIANYFNISVDDLLLSDMTTYKAAKENTNSSIGKNIPVYEDLSSVVSLKETETNIYETVSNEWFIGYNDYFGVKLNDNSMAPNYIIGDVIIFNKTDCFYNKEDCLVKISNKEVLFRRLIKRNDGIILQPINSEYEPIYYTNREIKELPVTILGIVKETRRRNGGELKYVV